MKSFLQLTIFLLVLISLPAHPDNKRPHRQNKYDAIFKNLTFENEGLTWSDVKALCIVETTNLNNDATSGKNAQGVCQVKPSTFNEVVRHKNKHKYHIRNPQHNIIVAANYLEQMYDRWESVVVKEDKLKFALASYNAGAGRIHKAVKKCNSHYFNDIKKCLPKQTTDYVNKVVVQRVLLDMSSI